MLAENIGVRHQICTKKSELGGHLDALIRSVKFQHPSCRSAGAAEGQLTCEARYTPLPRGLWMERLMGRIHDIQRGKRGALQMHDGTRADCGGASADVLAQTVRTIADTRGLESCSKPTGTLVHGGPLGLGMELEDLGFHQASRFIGPP